MLDPSHVDPGGAGPSKVSPLGPSVLQSGNNTSEGRTAPYVQHTVLTTMQRIQVLLQILWLLHLSDLPAEDLGRY